MKTLDWFYCFSFVVGTLVNKYVLTVKDFAFPTVFQSWQCVGVCLVILVESVATSRLSELNAWSAKQVARWLPLGFLVAIDLYSKSRALAQLDVPNYLLVDVALLAVTDGFVMISRALSAAAQKIQLWNSAALCIGCLLCLTLTALVIVLDTEAPRDAYVWALMHCGIEATMNLLIWPSLQPSRDQCFWTHLTSLALLMPVGYAIGQMHTAWHMPGVLESEFMAAFFVSSALAGVIALTLLWMQQYGSGQVKMASIIGKAMLFIVSFAVYDSQIGETEGITLLVGIVACVGMQVLLTSQQGRAEPSSVRPASPELSTSLL